MKYSSVVYFQVGDFLELNLVLVFPFLLESMGPELTELHDLNSMKFHTLKETQN